MKLIISLTILKKRAFTTFTRKQARYESNILVFAKDLRKNIEQNCNFTFNKICYKVMIFDFTFFEPLNWFSELQKKLALGVFKKFQCSLK